MKKIILFCFLTTQVFYQMAYSQGCGSACCGTEAADSNDIQFFGGERSMVCSKTANAWMNYYRLQQNYIPHPNSIEAVKIIPINYVIFGESDSTGFPFKPEHWPANKDSLTWWVNECFAIPQPTVHTVMNPAYVSETRIRFEIKEMYFYANSSILNNNTPSQAWQAMNHHFAENPEAKNQLNWYVVKNSSAATGYATSVYYAPENSSFPVVVSGSGYSNYDAPCGTCYFISSGHLRHELGHLFGLRHPYFMPLQPWQAESLIQDEEFLDDLFPDPPAYYPEYSVESGLSHLNSDNFMGSGGPNGAMFVSPKQIGRMHRALTTDGPNQNGHHYLRHYAYGYSSSPRIIDTDQTWDFTFKSYNDIVVKPGATLTLTCRLEMVPQAKIIVERGGTLIVDGATITSARCGGPEHEGVWQGIEVWGDPTRHQLATDANGDSYHGRVFVTNDALIENARVAIQAWRPGTWDHGGGIIQAEESTFRNNWKTIHFGSYTYSTSVSSFKNCIFETTQDLIDGSTPVSFIEAWSIRGILVNSNIFRNTNPNADDATKLGKGIYLESARAIISGTTTGTVTDFCNEQNPNWQPNRFENLYKGVELVNFGMQQTNGIYTSLVNRNVFVNCIYGIESKGMPAVRIEQNKVIMGGNNQLWFVNEGISHRSYTGFSITENCVVQNGTNAFVTGGIIVTDVSGDNNLVYRNYSFNVEHAFLSNGKNRTAAPTSQRHSGLQFLCNQNNGIQKYDISVVAADPNDPMSGIRYYQGGNGSASNPWSAANLFTNTCGTIESDIYNNTINPIVYFHTLALGETPVCKSWNVSNPTLNVSPNGCPSRIAGGGTGISTKSALTAEFAIRNSQFIVVSLLYHNLLDNGNTEALLQSINSSYSNNPVVLKNLLLNNSPNLSDRLIQELISDYTILTNQDLLQIIAANPDVAHNEELLKMLMEKVNPMDVWMIDFLRNAGTYMTDRTELEKLFAQKQYERDEIAWEMVRLILSDSTSDNYDQEELFTWLNYIGTPRAKYLMADDYASRANFSAAWNVLNNMNYADLDRFEVLELDDLKEWLTIQENLFNTGRTVYELDSTELLVLETLADDLERNGLAGTFAANLLNHYAPGTYEMNHLYPASNKSASSAREPRVLKPANKEDIDNLLIYPNPANNKVTLLIEAEKGNIVIYDINGVLVQSLPSAGQRFFTLDVSNFVSGTYVVRVLDEKGNEVQNGKLVVNK